MTNPLRAGSGTWKSASRLSLAALRLRPIKEWGRQAESTVIHDDATIKTGDILGSVLNDSSERKLGTIREIFLDCTTGQAKFAIVELNAVFGTGGKFHPVPWSTLRFSNNRRAYSTLLTKDVLKSSPAYDRDQLADASYAWGEQTERYFSERFG